MSNQYTDLMVAVQDGLAEVRAGSMAAGIDRLAQNFHDVMSFITAHGMAFAALTVVGLILAILGGMAWNYLAEYRIEKALAEEAAGKLQLEVFDLQDKVFTLQLDNRIKDSVIGINTTRINRLQSENEELDELNDQLTEDLTDANDRISYLDGKVKELDAENEELADAKSEMIDKIDELATDLENMTEDRDYWEENCLEARDERNDLEEQVTELDEEIETLNNLLELHKELVAANDEVYAEAA